MILNKLDCMQFRLEELTQFESINSQFIQNGNTFLALFLIDPTNYNTSETITVPNILILSSRSKVICS